MTVVPYDPFSHGEQVYLGSMDIELSFVKQNLRTEQQFDSDELAKFFIKVILVYDLSYPRPSKLRSLPQDKNSRWTIDPSK